MTATRARQVEIETSERMCIVTRDRLPPEEMIRFVLSPEGAVVPDLKKALPGRGVWVSGNSAAVAKAIKSGAFARAFKRPVSADAELPARIEELLVRSLTQALSLANKAGLVVAGAFQVEKMLENEDPAVVIHASDGGADGDRKIRQVMARNAIDPAAVFRVDFLTAEQIGLALGRTSVVHAAVRRGPAAKSLVAGCRRLQRFRDLASDSEAVREREDEMRDPVGSEDGQAPGIGN